MAITGKDITPQGIDSLTGKRAFIGVISYTSGKRFWSCKSDETNRELALVDAVDQFNKEMVSNA